MKQNVILIAFASIRIDMASIKMLVEKGHIAYAATRILEKMKGLETMDIRIIKMDATNKLSIKSNIQQIVSKRRGVDIFINNAGYGSLSAKEKVSIDEARWIFEVNVFGATCTSLYAPKEPRSYYNTLSKA